MRDRLTELERAQIRCAAREAVVDVRQQRARELGKKARAYGVPSGGALVIDHRGRIEAHGVPAPVFEALPNRKAKLEETLEVPK